MLLFLLTYIFFVRSEERAIYEHRQFMKKYLLENPQLVKKKIKETDQVKTTSV